jgi:hypothetical protein
MKPMPIIRLFERQAFSPEHIKVLTAAFEDVLRALDLIDRTDPQTELVARKIIECAQTGERDPVRLRDCALKLLRD